MPGQLKTDGHYTERTVNEKEKQPCLYADPTKKLLKNRRKKKDCDSSSIFRNCIPQLLTQSLSALAPGRVQDEAQWSARGSRASKWSLLASKSVNPLCCSTNINLLSDLKMKHWNSKSSKNATQCIKNEMSDIHLSLSLSFPSQGYACITNKVRH